MKPAMYYPYPGLRPYFEYEGDIFYGRLGHEDSLLEKLNTYKMVFVIGPSGCGKSSLVCPGLYDALNSGRLINTSRDWNFIKFTPGNNPIQNLVDCLCENIDGSNDEKVKKQIQGAIHTKDALRYWLDSKISDTDKFHLLVIDQFEEIFEYRKPGKRERNCQDFIKSLISLYDHPINNLYVVFTMRSDYIGDCTAFQGFPELINSTQILVPSLTEDELEEALFAPAEIRGVTFEPVLKDKILEDIYNESNKDLNKGYDILPIAQHMMLQLWLKAFENIRLSKNNNEIKDRDPDNILTDLNEEDCAKQLSYVIGETQLIITEDDYREVGKVEKALQTHAEKIYHCTSHELGAENIDTQCLQLVTQIIFRRITGKDSDGKEKRTPAKYNELLNLSISLLNTKFSENDIKSALDCALRKFSEETCSFIKTPSDYNLNSPNNDDLIDIGHESLIRQWKLLNNWVNSEYELGRQLVGLADDSARLKETETFGARQLKLLDSAWKKYSIFNENRFNRLLSANQSQAVSGKISQFKEKFWFRLRALFRSKKEPGRLNWRDRKSEVGQSFLYMSYEWAKRYLQFNTEKNSRNNDKEKFFQIKSELNEALLDQKLKFWLPICCFLLGSLFIIFFYLKSEENKDRLERVENINEFIKIQASALHPYAISSVNIGTGAINAPDGYNEKRIEELLVSINILKSVEGLIKNIDKDLKIYEDKIERAYRLAYSVTHDSVTSLLDSVYWKINSNNQTQQENRLTNKAWTKLGLKLKSFVIDQRAIYDDAALNVAPQMFGKNIDFYTDDQQRYIAFDKNQGIISYIGSRIKGGKNEYHILKSKKIDVKKINDTSLIVSENMNLLFIITELNDNKVKEVLVHRLDWNNSCDSGNSGCYDWYLSENYLGQKNVSLDTSLVVDSENLEFSFVSENNNETYVAIPLNGVKTIDSIDSVEIANNQVDTKITDNFESNKSGRTIFAEQADGGVLAQVTITNVSQSQSAVASQEGISPNLKNANVQIYKLPENGVFENDYFNFPIKQIRLLGQNIKKVSFGTDQYDGNLLLVNQNDDVIILPWSLDALKDQVCGLYEKLVHVNKSENIDPQKSSPTFQLLFKEKDGPTAKLYSNHSDGGQKEAEVSLCEEQNYVQNLHKANDEYVFK